MRKPKKIKNTHTERAREISKDLRTIFFIDLLKITLKFR